MKYQFYFIFTRFSYARRWGNSSRFIKIIFSEHTNSSFAGAACCSGGRSPQEGSGKQLPSLDQPASLDQHPWTSIPGKMLGKEEQGLEGKLICSVIFTALLKTTHIGQVNKQGVQTTSAFITVDSIRHVFLIFCLCISYKLY